MKLEMIQDKKTVVASASMHPYAFLKATKLAETLNGQVCTTDLQARFKATFKSTKVAKQFVTEWNAQYEQAQVDKQAKANAEVKKPQLKHTRKAKGNNKATWQSDLDKLAGTGRASNHKAASILRKHKMSAQIGTEGWDYWSSIR